MLSGMLKTLFSAVQRLWQAPHRAAWLTSVVAAVIALVGVASAVQRVADHHIAAVAERAASTWARQLAATVPDLDLLFLGERPSAQAQDVLTSLRGMAGLVRFKLYDPQGDLQLVSDSVATAPQPQDTDAASQALARRVAQGGREPTEVRQGDGSSAPKVYSRHFVAVQHGAATIGVAEFWSDQSDSTAAAETSVRLAALATAVAIALGIGAVALFLRQRAAHVSQALERAAFLTEHDVLTGALNHRDFSRRVEQACHRVPGGPASPAGGLAVICIDLDGFREINDRHGHAVGDEVLRRTAERLQGVLRGADLLARLAGDRFAVLQHGAADGGSVTALVQRIVSRLSDPHDLPGLSEALCVTAGVGAALHGVDGNEASALMNNAELALLRAKASGRGSWSFYDASLDRQLQERRALANDLRAALAQGALRLHFQPVYGSTASALIGYEALARWPHPTRGSVPPVEFIPVAEQTGQIQALGRWVLAAACTEAATWPAHLSVAVNLSAAQFGSGAASQAIVAEVAEALQHSGLAAGRLELEITESLLMNHTEQVLATLHALHKLGVRIAMDDFGTGYSSLAYLWRFPFDKLKIDRAFTQGLGTDPRVAVIVRSIVTMAHSLSIRVNAEGVETVAQRDALWLQGCDELQGYLLGRPVPVERLVHREAEVAVLLASELRALVAPT